MNVKHQLDDHPLVTIRLTYSEIALGITVGGLGSMPVMLFEAAVPVTIMTETGLPPESVTDIEAAISQGLPRWPPTESDDLLRPCPNWRARLGDGYAELHGQGALWGRGPVDVHTNWRAALGRCSRRAIVLYGPLLGVRIPPGMSSSDYTNPMRRTELSAAIQVGAVAGACLKVDVARQKAP